MLISANPQTGSAITRPAEGGGTGSTFIWMTPNNSGYPGGSTTGTEGPLQSALAAAVQSYSQGPRARWRASKGSAPVNRFTRAIADNATDGWHQTMPVGIDTTPGGVLYTLALAASQGFAGGLAMASQRALGGSIDPASQLVKASQRALAASQGFAGTVTGSTVRLRDVAGAVSFAGAVLSAIALARDLTASLVPEGAVVRFMARSTAGSTTPSSTLDGLSTLARTFAAGVGFTGAVVFVVPLQATLAGVLLLAGATLGLWQRATLRFRSLFPGADPHRRG